MKVMTLWVGWVQHEKCKCEGNWQMTRGDNTLTFFQVWDCSVTGAHYLQSTEVLHCHSLEHVTGGLVVVGQADLLQAEDGGQLTELGHRCQDAAGCQLHGEAKDTCADGGDGQGPEALLVGQLEAPSDTIEKEILLSGQHCGILFPDTWPPGSR